MSARPTRPKKRRDFGRVVAVILCVLFAIIGAVPLLLGVLVRTSVVRSWVADRTEVLIARELGVAATYEIEVEAWPMRVALLDLTVDASDGGPAFLRVERATARPRLFSLLAGELDVGEIQIDRPWIRAVLREGELTNLRYRLPPSDPSKPASLPFSSLAVTEARVDLVVDETRVLTQELDADVSVEPGNKLEIALHVGGATVTRTHPTADWPDEDAVDEDRICALEARARIEGDEILLRRLNISGSADFDPDPGTVPPCALPSGDWRAFEVAISALRVTGFTALAPRGSGRIHAKLPPAVAHRFVKLPHLTGSITLDAEAEYTGGRLPIVTGKITADSPGADGKVFAETLSAQLTVTDSAAILTNLQAVWGSGKVHIAEAKVEPFSPGKKLTAGPVHIEGIDFPDLIRDLGVHPQATVGWSIKKADLPSFGGTLDPLDLEGDLTAQTEDFAVYDRSARRPERRRMIGLEEAKLRGTFAVRQQGVSFEGFTVDSPRSLATHLATTVTIGFKNTIDLTVYEGSSVDLTEITPLVDIPISGIAKVKAVMRGTLTRPKLTGDVSITDFVFGGLPVGLVESAKAEFEPLKLTVTEARIRKGTSVVKVPRARFAFDEGPAVLVEADIDTREPPYLDVHDLLDIFQMDKLPHDGRMIPDPRWSEIQARTAGTARIRFVAGGPEDRCGGGVLRVDGDMRLLRAQLYGETYDEGDVDFLLVWDDKRAGANGMKLDVRSAILRKGSGAITATALVRHGGVLRAQALAAGIPIQSLDILGEYGDKFDGSINAVARIGGRLDAMNGLIDVEVSRVRVGPATLPPSRFEVQILPRRADSKPPAEGADDAELQRALQRTCGGSAGSPYDYNRFLSDPTDGDYVVNGALFGGQVEMHEVKISQQRRKVVRGAVEIKDLDLGALANVSTDVAFKADAPEGKLTASLALTKVPLTDLARAEGSVTLSKVALSRGGQTVRLLDHKGPITLAANTLTVPGLRVEARTASGLSVEVVADGRVDRALTAPSLDVSLRTGTLDLQRLSADIPGVERASGKVDGQLRVKGPWESLQYSGAAHLRNGELYVKGLPVGLTDAQVDIDVGGGDIRIKRAVARLGAGTLSVTGGVPIRAGTLGIATAAITARGVKLPVADGVSLTADADLKATLRPRAPDLPPPLPEVTGTVELTSFSYTRPIELAVSLGQLASRQRTAVDTYDPDNDSLRFDLRVVSPKPLRFTNNLVDMQLAVVEPGLQLSGTNQRYGAKGLLRILPESKLRLRNTEFEVREGSVRFDDPSRIAPKVDVRATTEYRRSSSSASAPAPDAAAAGSQSAQAGNFWRIVMHAYGNAEALKVDLTSDPALRQEDIVLLLTFGLTRAELDQGLAASSLGETVGLEALSALTGADKAVRTIVPVIDEFRFGTTYSSRTNRTQPMVTVGKRISDSVRATVTTGVTENRDVRGTIEWQLDKGVRIQGSYDNFNDTFGLPFGNLGADLRWRIEFE